MQLDAGLARVELRLSALLLEAMLVCLAAAAALFGLHGLTWGTAWTRQVVAGGEVATVET